MELTFIILCSLLILLALVIYLGKGDWLIAGYNTASPQEREKYNIHRVRLTTSVCLVVVSLVLLLELCLPPTLVWLPAVFIVIIGVVATILMNTWGKK